MSSCSGIKAQRVVQKDLHQFAGWCEGACPALGTPAALPPPQRLGNTARSRLAVPSGCEILPAEPDAARARGTGGVGGDAAVSPAPAASLLQGGCLARARSRRPQVCPGLGWSEQKVELARAEGGRSRLLGSCRARAQARQKYTRELLVEGGRL